MEDDTIKLLRECDAGIKMGISAIDEVIDYVEHTRFAKLLLACRDQHEKLKMEITHILFEGKDDGKDPNPIAKGMSWVKTNVRLVMQDSDQTIADLMTDGCNMGVKSLRKYLNQYTNADEEAKDITKRLINIEEKLTVDIREFL